MPACQAQVFTCVSIASAARSKPPDGGHVRHPVAWQRCSETCRRRPSAGATASRSRYAARWRVLAVDLNGRPSIGRRRQRRFRLARIQSAHGVPHGARAARHVHWQPANASQHGGNATIYAPLDAPRSAKQAVRPLGSCRREPKTFSMQSPQGIDFTAGKLHPALSGHVRPEWGTRCGFGGRISGRSVIRSTVCAVNWRRGSPPIIVSY